MKEVKKKKKKKRSDMRTTRVELVITRLQGEGLNHWAKRAADR